MDWQLYPPFFVTRQGFDSDWEEFCCTLLNLENRTTEVRRRLPPDDGIDLYWDSRAIAYQCKTVASGRSADFRIFHTLGSITQAQFAREKVPWNSYALCTNVDLTGSQESKLRHCLPGIALLTRSHWLSLCRKFRDEVSDYFRLLVDADSTMIDPGALNQDALRSYLRHAGNGQSQSSVVVFSKAKNTLFRLPVRKHQTAGQLLEALIKILALARPISSNVDDPNAIVDLEYQLRIDQRPVASTAFLDDLITSDEHLVTVFVKVRLSDLSGHVGFAGLANRVEPHFEQL